MFLSEIICIPSKHSTIGPNTDEIHARHSWHKCIHRIFEWETICSFYFMTGTCILGKDHKRIFWNFLRFQSHPGNFRFTTGNINIQITRHCKTTTNGSIIGNKFQTQICIINQTGLANSRIIKSNKLAFLSVKGQNQVFTIIEL